MSQRNDLMLRRLDGLMKDCAEQAVAQPTNRTEFGYGQVVGMYAGLYKARELVVLLLDEEDEANL